MDQTHSNSFKSPPNLLRLLKKQTKNNDTVSPSAYGIFTTCFLSKFNSFMWFPKKPPNIAQPQIFHAVQRDIGKSFQLAITTPRLNLIGYGNATAQSCLLSLEKKVKRFRALLFLVATNIDNRAFQFSQMHRVDFLLLKSSLTCLSGDYVNLLRVLFEVKCCCCLFLQQHLKVD